MGSWRECRTERDGELSCLFIITLLLLVAWMKGDGRWLIFLYHIGLWLLIWEMSQSSSNKIFAFGLNRCLGARAFSPPASINEGGRDTLSEEAVRNQAALTQARGMERELEVSYSPLFPATTQTRWPGFCMAQQVTTAWRSGEVGKYFLWMLLTETQTTEEGGGEVLWGHLT